MILDITYINSKGDSICFGTNKPDKATSWHFTDTDLFSFNLGYRSTGGIITSFKTEPNSFGLKAMLYDGSLSERDRFIDLISYDLATNQKGKLYVNDACYLECWINGADESDWHISDGLISIDVTITTDAPKWIRKHTIQLLPNIEKSSNGLNYPHDYPYNYSGSNSSNQDIFNPFSIPAKVDIAFAGPCVNPYVIIDGNRYEVNESAEKGELIIVKGYGKKAIIKRSRIGSDRDIFAKGVRKKNAQVFNEIPPGQSLATWAGLFSISIDMYEERYLPCWT